MNRREMRELVRKWLALDRDSKLQIAHDLGFTTEQLMAAKASDVIEKRHVSDMDEIFMREIQTRGLIDALAKAVDATKRTTGNGRENMPTKTDYTQIPGFERKVVSAVGVKALDESKGIVEMYVAGIGNVDDGGDIIEPGWATASLKARKPKGVWGHDWDVWIAKTLDTYEVKAGDERLSGTKLAKVGAGAQYVKAQFNLETQKGRDALSDVLFFGDECEFSIGYAVPDGGAERDKKGIRHLKTVDWYEWSPVLFGMNPATSLASATNVKSFAGSLVASVGNDKALAALEELLGSHELAEKAVASVSDETKAADEAKSETERASLDVKWLGGGDLEGSWEAVQDALYVAVNAWARQMDAVEDAGEGEGNEYDLWASVVGTFDAEVVFVVYDYDEIDPAERVRYFQASWATAADGSVSLGEPTQVDLTTTVTPKALAAFIARKVGARHSSSDQAAIQRAHDATVDAGASCDTQTTADDGKTGETVADPEGFELSEKDRQDFARLESSLR